MLERESKEVSKHFYLGSILLYSNSHLTSFNKDNYNPSSTTFKVILTGSRIKLNSSCSLNSEYIFSGLDINNCSVEMHAVKLK